MRSGVMICGMDGKGFVELRNHSSYSFSGGASSVAEIVGRGAECVMWALGLTDRANLCGALEFTMACRAAGVAPVVGAEIPFRWEDLEGWVPLLVGDGDGYRSLSGMISVAHLRGGRVSPLIDWPMFEELAGGDLVALVGGGGDPLANLLDGRRYGHAGRLVDALRGVLGQAGVVLQVGQHLASGDTRRNGLLAELACRKGLALAASNDVWYHVRGRARVHDVLVAVGANLPLNEARRLLRANHQYWLKRPWAVESLLRSYPEALAGTTALAERCAAFRLDRWVEGRYRVPDGGAPSGYDEQGWLERVCLEAAGRRYGTVDRSVRERLDEEFRLIRRHGLAGFLLAYRRIVDLGRECMVELGYGNGETPLEWLSPGRGRGSSVALLVGYLIGLSHVDPLAYGLSLDRFMSDDMVVAPDIDIDFPRDIRERLIVRVIEEWGWDHAALAAMFPRYRMRGAIRAAGRALGLPADEVGVLAMGVEDGRARHMDDVAGAARLRGRAGWSHLLDIAPCLVGLPKSVAQHPGGMLVSGTPLLDLVPVQPAAIEGRYVAQWDKNSVDDAGVLKIDLLGLGALSQLQETVRLVRGRTGAEPDLSRINFEDEDVFADLGRGDTIGVFQVESAAQMQTIVRLQPSDMYDLAVEIGAVRPGVGVNDGVSEYLRRRGGGHWHYTHDLEEGPLARTHGVILFQDQVVQLGMAVAGMTAGEADRMRRSLGRPGGGPDLDRHRERFLSGAVAGGVAEIEAEAIFSKFNAFYMFPEGHALAFAFTAYQMAWLRRYYPLEFYVALFNQQPMGFWDVDTLKQDARRLGIEVLGPDVNLSWPMSAPEGPWGLRLGLRMVWGVDARTAERIVEVRDQSWYRDVADLVSRAGLSRAVLESLALAGGMDGISGGRDRREVVWMVSGAQGRVACEGQMSLPLSVPEPPAGLVRHGSGERVLDEYSVLGMSPSSHVMELVRGELSDRVVDSSRLHGVADGQRVVVAGRVVRRQRPLSSAIYLTLEDEFGLIPVLVWERSWPRLRRVLSRPLVMVSGRVSRKDGAFNVVARRAWPLVGAREMSDRMPPAHDWH